MSVSAQTLNCVREAVASVIDATPQLAGYPDLKETLTERMLKVSTAAAELLEQERELTNDVAKRPRVTRSKTPLATAQAAGDIHRRTAVSSAAGTLRDTMNAIDFPGFVTSLISGVFQAIQNSTIQQLEAYSSLLEAVSASSDDFASSNISVGRAAQWIASRFPRQFVVEGEGEDIQLSLNPDSDEDLNREGLQQALGATEDEMGTVDESELTETLIPLVQRKLGRDRQQMLATMVLMGMQRIVVDAGKIHASMNMQIDARSIAEQRQAEQLDTRVSTSASGSFGVGNWGASASVSATVGFVRSDDQYSREDIALQAGLRSSVDVDFRTDQIPLDRMASREAQRRIAAQARVPDFERQSLLQNATPQTSAPSFTRPTTTTPRPSTPTSTPTPTRTTPTTTPTRTTPTTTPTRTTPATTPTRTTPTTTPTRTTRTTPTTTPTTPSSTTTPTTPSNPTTTPTTPASTTTPSPTTPASPQSLYGSNPRSLRIAAPGLHRPVIGSPSVAADTRPQTAPASKYRAAARTVEQKHATTDRSGSQRGVV
ncbi:MAG: hypothetical protein JXA30_22745 [Deltaproteobacteria bacterium]|nr:hypothetical protein [Deltaproteobacteria bacterium]